MGFGLTELVKAFTNSGVGDLVSVPLGPHLNISPTRLRRLLCDGVGDIGAVGDRAGSNASSMLVAKLIDLADWELSLVSVHWLGYDSNLGYELSCELPTVWEVKLYM